MDGADNGTTFTDDSDSGHTVTRNGDAITDTDQKKFGTASAYFDGNGDYLSVADSDDFNFGSGAFTIDFWFRDDGTSTSYPNLVGNQSSGGWGSGAFSIRYNNTGQASKVSVHWNDEGDPVLTSSSTFATATWHHVAVVRSSNTLYLFVNGIQEDSESISASLDLSFSSSVRIGGGTWDGANSYFKGWIDELRVTKGRARWTANFKPRDEAYGSETVSSSSGP
jgi:hypothetical protein